MWDDRLQTWLLPPGAAPSNGTPKTPYESGEASAGSKLGFPCASAPLRVGRPGRPADLPVIVRLTCRLIVLSQVTAQRKPERPGSGADWLAAIVEGPKVGNDHASEVERRVEELAQLGRLLTATGPTALLTWADETDCPFRATSTPYMVRDRAGERRVPSCTTTSNALHATEGVASTAPRPRAILTASPSRCHRARPS